MVVGSGFREKGGLFLTLLRAGSFAGDLGISGEGRPICLKLRAPGFEISDLGGEEF